MNIAYPNEGGLFVLSDGTLGNPGCDECGEKDAVIKVDGTYLCYSPLISRKQYLDEHSAEFQLLGNGHAAHRRFWAQFVGDDLRLAVQRMVGMDALLASTDPYLNDVPGNLRIFEAVGRAGRKEIKPADVGMFGYSQSDFVCIAKEAARQVIDAYNAAHASGSSKVTTKRSGAKAEAKTRCCGAKVARREDSRMVLQVQEGQTRHRDHAYRKRRPSGHL